MTLFSCDAGQGLTEHTSPFEALVQGTGRVTETHDR